MTLKLPEIGTVISQAYIQVPSLGRLPDGRTGERQWGYEGICFAARMSRSLTDRVQPILQSLGVPFGLLTGNRKPSDDAVALATFHRAKGTEFPIMVLVGVEDGLVPLRGQGETREELDRERALLFVAATRAREGLVCSAVGAASLFALPYALALMQRDRPRSVDTGNG